jgi:hypothetical protein
MLSKLWSTVAFSAVDSTHWALFAVSSYDPPLSLFHWMLNFALAPLFPLVSWQEISIQMPFSPNSWLVPDGFLVVQSIHIRLWTGDYDLVVCLKFLNSQTYFLKRLSSTRIDVAARRTGLRHWLFPPHQSLIR